MPSFTPSSGNVFYDLDLVDDLDQVYLDPKKAYVTDTNVILPPTPEERVRGPFRRDEVRALTNLDDLRFDAQPEGAL